MPVLSNPSPMTRFVAQLQRLAIAAHQRTAQTVHLTSDQQHYLTRVLRLKEGDRSPSVKPVKGFIERLSRGDVGGTRSG